MSGLGHEARRTLSLLFLLSPAGQMEPRRPRGGGIRREGVCALPIALGKGLSGKGVRPEAPLLSYCLEKKQLATVLSY